MHLILIFELKSHLKSFLVIERTERLVCVLIKTSDFLKSDALYHSERVTNHLLIESEISDRV